MKNLLFCLISFFSLSIYATESVPVLKIRDAIHVGTFETVKRLLDESKGAPAVIIELDTPGGYLESTRDIVQLFLSSETPVIVWVTPEGARAASAGSMITMAAHFAAMSPSTSIGAATPVSSGGEIPKDMKKKVENDTLSFVRGIAEKRGRNADWAAASVSEAASLTATDALKKNVIDALASTRGELWSSYRKKHPSVPESVSFYEVELNLKEQVLSFISNPNVAYGLMALGALGIYAEITHPGLIVPGAVGALCLALGAMTTKIIPIRPGAIVLLIVGLILMAIEILTPLPTYGAAGFGGAVALLLSGIFLLDTEQTNLRLAAGLWLPIFLVACLFMGGLGYASMKALKDEPFPQGLSALLGKEAEVIKVLSDSEAKIQVHGELWTARWKQAGSQFRKGMKVRVVEQQSLTALVEPLDKEFKS